MPARSDVDRGSVGDYLRVLPSDLTPAPTQPGTRATTEFARLVHDIHLAYYHGLSRLTLGIGTERWMRKSVSLPESDRKTPKTCEVALLRRVEI
jgi:hypothetical protein